MTTHPDTTYPPLLVQGQTWQEMTAGSVFRTAARTITETDLVTFVTWSGFNEALFLDASHAAAGGYTGRLVPGALVYCLGEGLVIQTNVINGTGLAFMSMDLSVKQPAYVGDTIHVVVEVTAGARGEHRPAGRGDHQEQRPQPARRGRPHLHAGPADPRPRLPGLRPSLTS